jgi:hypothetical protein
LSSDGYELWSDKFDRGVSDAFAIQEEIARAVVAALGLRVQSDSARHPGTINAQAYEMYLRGPAAPARDRTRELPAGTADVHARHRAGPRIRAAACRHRESDAIQLQWLLIPKEQQPALLHGREEGVPCRVFGDHCL